jgi:hypothetical protein
MKRGKIVTHYTIAFGCFRPAGTFTGCGWGEDPFPKQPVRDIDLPERGI